MSRISRLAAALALLTGCPGSSPDESPAAGPPPDDTAGPEPVDLGGCACPSTLHCGPSGACVEDVCIKSAATCNEAQDAVVQCNADGSDFTLQSCGADAACVLGGCLPRICAPGAPPDCDGYERRVCNGTGTGYSPLPCPGASTCVAGACVAVEPNVLLVMDTSGSMNWVTGDGATPADCVGDSCVPWTWPQCDDSNVPVTRLGKAKLALADIVQSDAAGAARLALQRFPQVGLLPGEAVGCENGLYSGSLKAVGDPGAHQVPLEEFAAQAWKFLIVPFRPGGGTSTAEILQWVDFIELATPNGEACVHGVDCASQLCVAKECRTQENPELRGAGATPIGRSLFFAGEYFRHQVAVEGKPCASTLDCGSPHHACEAGACHDPFWACRPHVVILLTDGTETADEDPGSFFHPRVQAKRLHYGLGCSSDADCGSGATCNGVFCEPAGFDGLPTHVCRATDLPCATDDQCPTFTCGAGRTCAGLCEAVGADLVDSEGADRLLNPWGSPVVLTIHMVDASGVAKGDSLIAALGGGQHVPVDFDHLDSLVGAVLALLDLKSPVSCGGSD